MGPRQARRDLLSAPRRRGSRAALALLLATLSGACAGDRAREADRAYTAGVARVDRVDVELVSTRPPRLRVGVEGAIPDACTEIDPPEIRTFGARIEITLGTRRAFGASCPAEESRFSRSIPVMLTGEFRLYVVDVNGVGGSVSLPPDRELLP